MYTPRRCKVARPGSKSVTCTTWPRSTASAYTWFATRARRWEKSIATPALLFACCSFSLASILTIAWGLPRARPPPDGLEKKAVCVLLKRALRCTLRCWFALKCVSARTATSLFVSWSSCTILCRTIRLECSSLQVLQACFGERRLLVAGRVRSLGLVGARAVHYTLGGQNCSSLINSKNAQERPRRSSSGSRSLRPSHTRTASESSWVGGAEAAATRRRDRRRRGQRAAQQQLEQQQQQQQQQQHATPDPRLHSHGGRERLGGRNSGDDRPARSTPTRRPAHTAPSPGRRTGRARQPRGCTADTARAASAWRRCSKPWSSRRARS